MSETDGDEFLDDISLNPMSLDDGETEADGKSVRPSKRQRVSCFGSDFGGTTECGGKHNHFKLMYGEKFKSDDCGGVLYTDWQITVKSPERERTFCVHKPILAAVSDYFDALFKDERNYPEHEGNCSTFEFPDAAVRGFEHILDYAYDPDYCIEDGRLDCSEPEAFCTLLYLSDYFQMQDLNAAVKRFLNAHRRGLGGHSNEMLKYHEMATELKTQFLWDFLMDWCVRSLGTIGSDKHWADAAKNVALLLKKMDLEFFFQVFKHPLRKTEEAGWLKVLVFVCKHHKVSAKFFANTLLDTKLVPKIWGKGAVQALNLLQVFLVDENSTNETELKGLLIQAQQRCSRELNSFLVNETTLASFNRLDLATSLHLDALKALVLHCTVLDYPSSAADPAVWVTWYRLNLKKLKRESEGNVPITVSGETNVSGTYFWDGKRYVNYYGHWNEVRFVITPVGRFEWHLGYPDERDFLGTVYKTVSPTLDSKVPPRSPWYTVFPDRTLSHLVVEI